MVNLQLLVCMCKIIPTCCYGNKVKVDKIITIMMLTWTVVLIWILVGQKTTYSCKASPFTSLDLHELDVRYVYCKSQTNKHYVL